MKANLSGHIAEFAARMLFRFKGYRVVASNYVTGRGTGAGEIDFIAVRGSTIVFVEVKQRSSIEKAAYAILPAQQKRIWKAAENFVQRHPRYVEYNIRFDAVLVSLPFAICHVADAFRL